MSATLDQLQHQNGLIAQALSKENQMAEDYKVQASLKVGDHMFNFRGQDVEEVTNQLEAFADHGDRVFEVYSKVKQITMTKGLTGFTPAPSTPNTQNTAPASGASAADLRCKHGAYKDFRGKTKKNGDPYQYRYYCPAPFGASDQCKPNALPGQEAWSK